MKLILQALPDDSPEHSKTLNETSTRWQLWSDRPRLLSIWIICILTSSC